MHTYMRQRELLKCTLHNISFGRRKLTEQENGGTVRLSQGVHYSSTINIHLRAQKGYYLEQTCTKCTYKRHIVIKHEVDVHEAGDKAIEKKM